MKLCPNGHRVSQDNTVWNKDGCPGCRVCHQMRKRRKKRRK